MHKIALAPTTLPNSPPLEYIDAAVRAGYDGIGIRLFRSPGITYAFHPVAGNPTLMREVKSAIASAGLEVFDVLSFYLQPAMALDSMLPSLAFGAEIGAKYALVIGLDPLQYFRAGHSVDLLRGQDPGLFPYTQITDGGTTGGRGTLGEGSVP